MRYHCKVMSSMIFFMLLFGSSLQVAMAQAPPGYYNLTESSITVIGPSGSSYSKTANITFMSTNKMTLEMTVSGGTGYWDGSFMRFVYNSCGQFLIGKHNNFCNATVVYGTPQTRQATDGDTYVPNDYGPSCVTGTHTGYYENWYGVYTQNGLGQCQGYGMLAPNSTSRNWSVTP